MITLRKPLTFSETGSKPNQEDYIFPQSPEPKSRVFILCDGMGGHERGEVASSTAANTIGGFLTEAAAKGTHIDKATFEEGLKLGYDALEGIPGFDSPRKPGTTLVALCFNSGSYLAAHIGDSRIYHIRPSHFDSESGATGIIYRSEDHSLVNQLVKAGQITEQQARVHPRRNVITRAMQPGLPQRFAATVRESANIKSGDYFFLCSDGVLERVDDRLLAEILATPGLTDAEKMAAILKQCDLGTRDNYSAILVPVDDVTLPVRHKPKRRNPYLIPLIIFIAIILIAIFGIASYYLGSSNHDDAPQPADTITNYTPPVDTVTAPDTIILTTPIPEVKTDSVIARRVVPATEQASAPQAQQKSDTAARKVEKTESKPDTAKKTKAASESAVPSPVKNTNDKSSIPPRPQKPVPSQPAPL